VKTLPIELPNDAIRAFCQRHRVRRLSLFGSVLRDDFTPESDVDVLLEFEPGAGVGMIAFEGLELELSGILGRKVDLNTPGSLSKYFVEEVLREAVPIHVAA
jgi:predicted nucleotidyltransferase